MSQSQFENQSQCPEASEDDADSCINSLSSASEADSSEDVEPARLPLVLKEYNTMQTSSATNHSKAKPPMVRTVASARATGQWAPGKGGGDGRKPPYRPTSIPPRIQGRMKKARRREFAKARANPPQWMKDAPVLYQSNSALYDPARHKAYLDLTFAQRQALARRRAQGTASDAGSSSSSWFERSLRR